MYLIVGHTMKDNASCLTPALLNSCFEELASYLISYLETHIVPKK